MNRGSGSAAGPDVHDDIDRGHPVEADGGFNFRRNLIILSFLFLLLSMAIVFAVPKLAPLSKQRQISSPLVLVVDPDVLLQMFVDQRGIDLQGEDFIDAVHKLDRVIALEAKSSFDQYGALIVKSDFVLAGGTDYTAAFFDRIIKSWDLVR